MPKHCEVVLYQEDGWDTRKIQETITKHTSIEKYCIALHDQDLQDDGSTAKPHFHVYLNAGKTNLTLINVAGWFNVKEQAVEKIKSDKSDTNQTMGLYFTLKYYTHEDIPEKHHYPASGFVANFDVEEALKTGAEKLQKRAQKRANKQQLREIYNKCADGTITPQNFHEHITPELYVSIKPMVERAWQYYEQEYQQKAQGYRDCVVIYVYGKSGTGKSLVCRLYAQQLGLTVYTTAYGQHPFDQYMDEDVVILDDIRPYVPFNHVQLLNLTDPHYMVKAEARYKNKLLKNSFLFITSVLSPQQLWFGFFPPKKKDDGSYDYNPEGTDSSKQLFRRFSEVWNVTETKIYIHKYVNDCFLLVNTVPNPVPAYLAQLPASRGNSLDSTSVFSSIKSKYTPFEPMQTSLFNGDCGEHKTVSVSANETLAKSAIPETADTQDDDDIIIDLDPSDRTELPFGGFEDDTYIEQEMPF